MSIYLSILQMLGRRKRNEKEDDADVDSHTDKKQKREGNIHVVWEQINNEYGICEQKVIAVAPDFQTACKVTRRHTRSQSTEALETPYLIMTCNIHDSPELVKVDTSHVIDEFKIIQTELKHWPTGLADIVAEYANVFHTGRCMKCNFYSGNSNYEGDDVISSNIQCWKRGILCYECLIANANKTRKRDAKIETMKEFETHFRDQHPYECGYHGKSEPLQKSEDDFKTLQPPSERCPSGDLVNSFGCPLSGRGGVAAEESWSARRELWRSISKTLEDLNASKPYLHDASKMTGSYGWGRHTTGCHLFRVVNDEIAVCQCFDTPSEEEEEEEEET